MIMGALGALYYRQNNKLFLKITDHKISQILCWLLILLATINKFHLASVIDNEIISVVAIFLIIGQINVKNRIVNLETSICDYLGKISYGIYVIHPLVIFIFSKILNRVHIQLPYKYFIVYIVILTTTIILAHLSYNYFEKYFMTLKKKYVVIESSATRGLELDQKYKHPTSAYQ